MQGNPHHLCNMYNIGFLKSKHIKIFQVTHQKHYMLHKHRMIYFKPGMKITFESRKEYTEGEQTKGGKKILFF